MPLPIKVLFLCTGNACRSQMAEAIAKHVGEGRFEAFSAGSHPAGFIHPLATAALDELGIPLEGQRSKSWDEFVGSDVKVVITLCDWAAQESCPVWHGSPVTANWFHPDPVAVEGDDEYRIRATVGVAKKLKRKIEQLVKLDFENTPTDVLAMNVQLIGDEQ